MVCRILQLNTDDLEDTARCTTALDGKRNTNHRFLKKYLVYKQLLVQTTKSYFDRASFQLVIQTSILQSSQLVLFY